MSILNDFLPFCPNDTGTNLETQAAYAADSNRTNGNQPGVASSQLNNKAIRQSTYVVSQLAQMIANVTGASVLDDATPAKLLAQMVGTFQVFQPKVTSYTTTAPATHNPTYIFMIASGSATVGATYTHNAATYTVAATVASAVLVQMTGPAAPLASGTLTKASGTGDATLTFYAYRAPIEMEVMAIGGGGGGGAATTNDGIAGSNSTFGSALIVAGGGGAGARAQGGGFGGVGGTASLGGLPGEAVPGGYGGPAQSVSGATVLLSGGWGGNSARGGGGGAGHDSAGLAGATNSGGGGGGGSVVSTFCGGGGGSGGYVRGFILGSAVLSSFAVQVGAGGIGGTAGGNAGGAGATGIILVIERYQ